MSHQQKTLWTKDFTSIAIATILTAVGGEAMNLPISLLVIECMTTDIESHYRIQYRRYNIQSGHHNLYAILQNMK